MANVRKMRIAVEGCCHGNLDKIYSRLTALPIKRRPELLLICGDFQAIRSKNDLECMAVPAKYRSMGDFSEYYNGTKKAPILTVFIGGNHEASNYLQELKFGGWVCPNIFYLGKANIINYRGLKIGGISGVYYKRDFMNSSYEKVPFDGQSIRLVYHTRKFEILKLLFFNKVNKASKNDTLDIFLSHDWPQGIEHKGNISKLLRAKPFFKKDIDSGNLGSPPNKVLLNSLRPRYWFSAHLHVRFTANYCSEIMDPISTSHANDKDRININIDESDSDDSEIDFPIKQDTDSGTGPEKSLKREGGDHTTIALKKVKTERITKFLALDKCRPKAQYLEIMDIESIEDSKDTCKNLMYDENFLKINKFFNDFASNQDYKNLQFDDIIHRTNNLDVFLDKYKNDIINQKLEKLDLRIPSNFKLPKTIPFKAKADTQTIEYCEKFDIRFDQDEY